jgi:hypothetical protein
MDNTKVDGEQPQNFSSKDVKDVAKEVGRTTIVWTAAGVITQLIRDVVKKFTTKSN